MQDGRRQQMKGKLFALDDLRGSVSGGEKKREKEKRTTVWPALLPPAQRAVMS